MGNLIYIRILQHDTEDQIRIGNSYPINDLDKAEENIVALYEKDTAWCGGFEAFCKQYYKHIAIIDADTLEVIRSIYGKKKEYVFIIENSQREVIGTITIQAESLPSHITICQSVREKFPLAATYKLQSDYNILQDPCPVEDPKSISGCSPEEASRRSFIAGSKYMKEKAIEAFKKDCPCWSRFEKGKKCDECSWLKDFRNSLDH